MKKRLILLILVLPIFLMLSLFVVTKTVSLAVEVPVSGIEIMGDDVVYLDLDKGEKYELQHAVYPTNAKNRDVTFSTEAVGEEPAAILEYVDGYIIPKSSGMAKVYLTTIDGGYKDSIIVQVDSSLLKSISSTVERDSILVGEKAKISTVFEPANATDLLLSYSSDNESVATVNAKGEIIGVGRGTATITVTSKVNLAITDTVEITVYQNDTLEIAQSAVSTWHHSGSINISISEEIEYEYSFKAYDKDGRELPAGAFTVEFDTSAWASGHIIANYSCTDESYAGDVRLVIYASYDGTSVSKECSLNFVKEIEVSFDADTFSCSSGQNSIATFTVVPEGADVSYNVTYSNDNVYGFTVDDGVIAFYAQKAGVTTVTLRVTDNTTGGYKEATADIVVKPRSLVISESANTYGDEGLIAVGSLEYGGAQSSVAIHLSYDASKAGIGFTDKLSYVTDSEQVSVDASGRIVISDGFVGAVNVYGVFSHGDVEYRTGAFRVMCVSGGVNVRSFEQLYRTVKAEQPVILHADIINDFGIINGKQYYTEDTVTKMHTTYDDTYYKNAGIEDQAFIRILLEFKNDIYGNGYTINASNVTMQLDSTGSLKHDALFRGPLNFVSMTEDGASAASVKAQDNVCFAVFEGVKVRNVKLYGCTLEADADGKLDLTDLNYVGTTVEVFGDDVSFKYVRMHNGRTVLRVFGDKDDATKVISVDISNSVLGGAREFIIRMGSNALKDCVTAENVNDYDSARLDGDTGLAFPVQTNYEKMTEAEKKAYEEKFIKTFVTVENCVFTDSGIFAVGIDSHFSGPYLQQGNTIFKNGQYAAFLTSWHDLAKTSYGAKLSFEGEVRMLCWKDVDTIDSSTLIEVTKGFEFGEKLAFDVGSLIKALGNDTRFKDIVYNSNGKQYVHAGITLFGGGKNYGVFEDNMDESQFSELREYKIGLGDAGMGFLESAAGSERFFFILHDSRSTFTPTEQDRILQSEDAYDCIHRAN
ncbi:MAG: Ig-like domain-containing protein [Clostridia bacterium]|nr:Ig-like domain-containing protein [Clostridia bacterium]